MFLLIYKSLEIDIFQAFSKRNINTTNLSILFEVRENSLPFFIFGDWSKSIGGGGGPEQRGGGA